MSRTTEVIRFEVARSLKKPSFWIAAILIPLGFFEERSGSGKKVLRKGPFSVVPIGCKIQRTSVAQGALRHAASPLTAVFTDRKQKDIGIIFDSAAFQMCIITSGNEGVMKFIHEVSPYA